MSEPTSSDWPEWVRYIASGVAGGVIMLVGVVRRWTRTERNSEEALAKALLHDGRISSLENDRTETKVRLEYITRAIDDIRAVSNEIHAWIKK